MAHISVLGTGRMGSALAIAFARAGHDVTVWNRTAAKAKHLEAEGVRVASSVVDAINPAELVVDNVSGPAFNQCMAAGLKRAGYAEVLLFQPLAGFTDQ